MKLFWVIFALLLFPALLSVGIALHSAAFAQGKQRVEFVSDHAKGIARIVIDGKTVALFNQDGLSVAGQINATNGVVAPPLHGEPLPPAAKVGEP